MEQFGPWKFPSVIDCGYLQDLVDHEVALAKTKSRQDVLRLLKDIRAAHAAWLEGHNLSRRALRLAGSPFRKAYNDVEQWLSKSGSAKA